MSDFSHWSHWFGRRHGRAKSLPTASEDQPRIGTADDGSAVYFPRASREVASHSAWFAGSGSGKSVVLALIIAHEVMRAQLLSEAERPSWVIIDPKSDLVTYLTHALAEKNLLGTVQYLDPFAPGGGFPFNAVMMERGATPPDLAALALGQAVGATSSSLGAGSTKHLSIGPRQAMLISQVIAAANACAHLPGASLHLALDGLRNTDSLKRLAHLCSSPRIRDALLAAEPGEDLLVSSRARLAAAIALTDDLEHATSVDACVSWSKLTAPGMVTCFDLGRPLAPGALSFWANWLAFGLFDFLLARTSDYPTHTRLVIDECQTVLGALEQHAENILCLGRSKNISLVQITQSPSLIAAASDTILRTTLSNTKYRYYGRVSPQDAEVLSREATPTLSVQESLSTARQRMLARLTNLSDRVFIAAEPGRKTRFTAIPVDITAWQAAATAHAAEITAIKERYRLTGPRTPRTTLDHLSPPKERRGRRGNTGGASGPSGPRWG